MSHQFMLVTWLLPGVLVIIIWRSRATAVATSWIMMVDRESEILIDIADTVSCWLIVIVLADPVSCWHLIVVVDHNGGSWWWSLMAAVDHDDGLWTMMASDHDVVSWSWWLLIVDYHYNKTASYTICILKYSTITDNNPYIYLPLC